jgi:UDP-N-acetylglucosamine/UDP-N-acetylgalactosamine 4-epimerase
MKAYPTSVHSLKGKHVLVTGGAGFIGSNLTEALLQIGASVTVLDNYATGLKSNIDRLSKYTAFRFLEADICKPSQYKSVLNEIDVISHQAALGSVPRSIEFPLNTHEVNATGFLTILHEAKEAGVKRFVFASSSSVYGDSLASPKAEGDEGNALSPYAVTKQLNEQYAAVYQRLHQMETIGLRYFNVFGPYQNPEGVYAAAIPRFLDKMLNGGEIIVNGDGEQTRDFTYVQNAVLANLLSLATENSNAFGKVYNVACGRSLTLNDVIYSIENGLTEMGEKVSHQLTYGPNRVGDIRDSLASTDLIERNIGYQALYSFEEGIREYLSHALND